MQRKKYDEVQDIFEIFLDQKRLQHLSPETITNYKHIFSLYNKVMMVAQLPVKEFVPEYLTEWHRFLQETELKKNTIKEYVSKMWSFHMWLYTSKDIALIKKDLEYLKKEQNEE